MDETTEKEKDSDEAIKSSAQYFMRTPLYQSNPHLSSNYQQRYRSYGGDFEAKYPDSAYSSREHLSSAGDLTQRQLDSAYSSREYLSSTGDVKPKGQDSTYPLQMRRSMRRTTDLRTELRLKQEIISQDLRRLLAQMDMNEQQCEDLDANRITTLHETVRKLRRILDLQLKIIMDKSSEFTVGRFAPNTEDLEQIKQELKTILKQFKTALVILNRIQSELSKNVRQSYIKPGPQLREELRTMNSDVEKRKDEFEMSHELQRLLLRQIIMRLSPSFDEILSGSCNFKLSEIAKNIHDKVSERYGRVEFYQGEFPLTLRAEEHRMVSGLSAEIKLLKIRQFELMKQQLQRAELWNNVTPEELKHEMEMMKRELEPEEEKHRRLADAEQENIKLRTENLELKNRLQQVNEYEKVKKYKETAVKAEEMQQRVNEYDTMMRLAGIDIDDLRQSIQGRTIGPEGGTIKFFSYEITFPKDAVDSQTVTRFYVVDDVDNLNLPPRLIPISLPLNCAPGGQDFNKSVNVKIPIWCSISETCDKSVSVLIYKKRSGGQWQLYCETPLTSSGFVSFPSNSFCKIQAGIDEKDKNVVTFSLLHFLCQNNVGSFVSVHLVSSDKLAEKLENKWLKAGYGIIYPTSTKLTVKPGDVLPVNLKSKEPDKYKFESAGETSLEMTKEFYKKRLHWSFSFLLDPENPASDTLKFIYTVGEKQDLIRTRLADPSGPANLAKSYMEEYNQRPAVQNILNVRDVVSSAPALPKNSNPSEAKENQNTGGSSQAIGINFGQGARAEIHHSGGNIIAKAVHK